MEKISNERRNLIRFSFVAMGAFILGKFFAPFKDFLTGDKVINEVQFKNFNYKETNKEFSFVDKTGDAIIIVEKDGL